MCHRWGVGILSNLLACAAAGGETAGNAGDLRLISTSHVARARRVLPTLRQPLRRCLPGYGWPRTSGDWTRMSSFWSL